MRSFFPTAALRIFLTRPAILSGLFAIAVTVLGGGCVSPRIPDDTAVVLVEMPFRNVNPLKATDAVSQKINNLIHGALVRFGPELNVVSELAESWKIEKYRRFSFKLRPGLRFHDGTLLTATDVVRAFESYKENSPHGIALEYVHRISAPNPLEVVLETKEARPFLLNDLPLLKVFKADGQNRFIGAGRFAMVRKEAHELELERFDGFYEPAPVSGLRKIVFRYVRDETTRYQLLMRGDGNVALSSFSMSKTHHLRRTHPGSMFIKNYPGINFSYLCFNLRDERLSKLKVRQALAHAIDVESIMKHRLGDLGTRATGVLSPFITQYFEPDVKRYDFDPERAEKLLDEAGYHRGPDGWRFSLAFKSTSEKYAHDLANVVAGQLRRVGIRATLDVVEIGTFYADIRAGNFDIYHSRWIGVTNPSIYFRIFHSSQRKKGLNRGWYSNTEVDRLIDLGMSEVDDSLRKRYFSRVQKIVAKELPYLNLWYWNNTFIGTSKMRDIVMYPNGDYLTLAQIRVGNSPEKLPETSK